MKNRKHALLFAAIIGIHLKEEYGKDIRDLFNNTDKLQKEEMIVFLIKKLTGFDYDAKNKVFTTHLENNSKFISEVVEPANIKSLKKLYEAVFHLMEAKAIRNQSIVEKSEIVLPEYLYKPTKKIQEISKENVLAFLKKEHGIENEKSLFELEENKHAEVIYNLFRTFTGCIAHHKSTGAILYSLPQDQDLKLSYNDLPNLDHTDLFSHLRDMRKVEKSNREMTEQITEDRIQQIKKMTKSNQQEQER